jgi:hypothetical protein
MRPVNGWHKLESQQICLTYERATLWTVFRTGTTPDLYKNISIDWISYDPISSTNFVCTRILSILGKEGIVANHWFVLVIFSANPAAGPSSCS